jgi:hypothetical protein
MNRRASRPPQHLNLISDLYPESVGKDEDDHPVHPMFTRPIRPHYDKNPTKYLQMNCQDVYLHLQHCPLCSQFYQCNKGVHTTIIVGLALLCALLLKKVLAQ